MISLTVFDGAIFTIISVSVVFAFFKGFIRSMLSLIKLVLAVVATFFLFPFSSDMTSDFITHPLAVNITASVAPFLLILILLTLLNNKLVSYLSDIHGGAIDRSLGAAFGLIRGCVFASLIFFLIHATLALLYKGNDSDHDRPSVWSFNKEIEPEWLNHSKSYRLLRLTTELFMSWVPESTQEAISDTMKQPSSPDMKKKKQNHKDPLKSETDKHIETIRAILNRLSAKALPEVDLQKWRRHPEMLLEKENLSLLDMIIEAYQHQQKINPTDDAGITEERLDTLKAITSSPASEGEKGNAHTDGSYSDTERSSIENLILQSQ